MNAEVKSNLRRKYRVQVTVAIYREGSLSYKSEILSPAFYSKRAEARDHIRQEIRERLAHSRFFRSTRLDYDLVRYTEEASCNTYLRYSIQDTEI
jgi:hypothetical protein